ncbi:AFR632Cp [Eremothecium gossypii ATCC 10895]|uniref:Restriction of telomere capping protein 4 n=1 Tax=Eremothecium gossypii (strain ATCC 10895 / CBS 109.51 / FGSC 9923 / NRRL Y-1056) TaxID=284811 RepID=RTC4_EREGS|nr:AFR632Cp [Eremothecium gossypii ATCC 10895]Q752E4.2 RecName: Full=Restriction of telomere capping protein 4 [Eremothecium gossypii ATCC 10895]AAS54003.2 AFR632Cp [Eremothecium gossypii ATCC 10895]AEY98317.1 FAFR632Cp [Eremothecium gossypii FDAG1]
MSHVRRKRITAIYSTSMKDDNAMIVKSHSSKESKRDPRVELSDNEYISNDEKDSTDAKPAADEPQLELNCSSSLSSSDDDSSVSSSISSSSELDALSEPGLSSPNAVPLVYKVPHESSKAIQVARRLENIHASVQKDDDYMPKLCINKSMVFTDRQDQVAEYERLLEIRLKYKNAFKVPPTLFADQLLSKAEKYIPLVEEILRGERPSMYYDNARKAYQKSSRALLSVEEFRQLDLKTFTAGYFGIKRQIRLSTEILSQYQDKLSKHRNPTVQWWGPTDFSHYVLAPEILSYVCRDELGLADIDEAWTYMESTTEYGLNVADEEPLDIWELEYEEKKLQRLGLGPKYSSMTYRKHPARASAVVDTSKNGSKEHKRKGKQHKLKKGQQSTKIRVSKKRRRVQPHSICD